MGDIDIADLARRSGVRASALRYYEEKGLIASVGRRGLKRLFDPSALERLSLIALGRASGFSLDEIAAILAGPGAPDIDKARLNAKADEIDRRVEALSRMRDGLRHAAACTAPSLMECGKFRRLIRFAGRDAAAPQSRRRFVAVTL
jgi:DNA-binding transcriptional MerR regulator